MSITSKELEIGFGECDYKGRYKLSAMLKEMTELAGIDYANKGLPYERLKSEGFAFLVSRFSVSIKRFPKNREKLILKTWEIGTKGASFLRGHLFEDENGDRIIEALDTWILVNPDTRKIYKPSEFPYSFTQHPELELNILPVGKIDAKDSEKAYVKTVMISDLDSNGHVFNAKYADIAYDALTESEFEHDFKNIRINFVNEAKLGNEIEVLKKTDEQKIVVSGVVNGKTSFEVEIE